MALQSQLQSGITRDPEVLGGTPCFRETRVPSTTFLDHVEAGCSLEQILKGYSSVDPVNAKLVLHWIAEEIRDAITVGVAS